MTRMTPQSAFRAVGRTGRRRLRRSGDARRRRPRRGHAVGRARAANGLRPRLSSAGAIWSTPAERSGPSPSSCDAPR